jgi:hypothetical protein
VSVIGGFVYRGTALPALRGAFVFADLGGVLWAIGVDGVQQLGVRFEGMVTFGESPDGGLRIANCGGDVARPVPG